MSKARLLRHERELVASGHLEDVTHAGASSTWLRAPPLPGERPEGLVCVYRPMCDREYAFLASHGLLPATQPYQTIVVGDAGRAYAEKYLRGRKRVDTYPTTVVEFLAPAALVRKLFERQSKPEDGCTSHGLGDKGGGGLGMFNASLASRAASWRIVLVKR